MTNAYDDQKSYVLSQDLLIYISHLEEAYNEIEQSDEKTIILEWLLLILEETNEDIAMARIRNMMLSQLLMDIEYDKLRYPFNERPSLRAFAELADNLRTVLNIDASLDKENEQRGNLFLVDTEPVDRALDLGDFHYASTDNRLYVAIRNLPHEVGAFGYVAVSIGEVDDTQWLNSKGEPIETLIPTDLPVKQIACRFQAPVVPTQCDVKKVWYALKHRRPLTLRNYSYEFYKMLYENVQQEMLAERNKIKCTHPYINKLLKFLEIDMKAIGIHDAKMFCRLKLLSILKKQIKYLISEIENRFETLETARLIATISPIVSLPPKNCYNFVTSTLWNEISQQRPGTKYMDILAYEYPQYFFPKYFSVLAHQKKLILTNISNKYCKILDEMFVDLAKSIMWNMNKYKDAKWEWHLAHEINDAYIKEKSFKDSLCEIENSTDETTESFLAVIFNEMEMAQDKLKSIVKKNDQLTEQLKKNKLEIQKREQMHKVIVCEYEEKMDKLKKETNNEKLDIVKRENTITELRRRIKDLEK
ncbi:Domain of unknown function DUF4485 [Cinara cedri]|uniref:DUF4485 domain-containing protein n=1 Tax=Cinara cedri TaxID=506608 RepID=A0A5E4N6E8_9HEMI|nr:Domain of unknown function DUF4485 [Cinara cedri]